MEVKLLNSNPQKWKTPSLQEKKEKGELCLTGSTGPLRICASENLPMLAATDMRGAYLTTCSSKEKKRTQNSTGWLLFEASKKGKMSEGKSVGPSLNHLKSPCTPIVEQDARPLLPEPVFLHAGLKFCALALRD